MQYNIDALSSFYDGDFGKLASKFIFKELMPYCNNLQNLEILGYGYTKPILKAIIDANLPPKEPRRIINYNFFQGVPETFCPYGKNISIIGEESNLPFQEASFDRIIVIHALEEAENPNRILRELWRILRPEGKIFFVIPNRRGILAQLESTPFGQGRPYSKGQFSQLLNESMFTISYSNRFLYSLPFDLLYKNNISNAIEYVGHNIIPHIGGLLFFAATKKITIEPYKNISKIKLTEQITTAY